MKIDKFTYLDILWPDENFVSENAINNNSIVCSLSYKGVSALFTGDIEKIAEERIVYKYEKFNNLNCTILKVAHHGSKSSSVQTFLDKVKPSIALIGVGQKNHFGHPDNAVIRRLEGMRYKGV